jgi:hypothetical protein
VKNTAVDNTDDNKIHRKSFCVMPKQQKTPHIGFFQHIPRLSPKPCLPKLNLMMRKQRMNQNGKDVKSEDSHLRAVWRRGREDRVVYVFFFSFLLTK